MSDAENVTNISFSNPNEGDITLYSSDYSLKLFVQKAMMHLLLHLRGRWG